MMTTMKCRLAPLVLLCLSTSATAQQPPEPAPPAAPLGLDPEWVAAITGSGIEIAISVAMFLGVLLLGWVGASIARGLTVRVLKRTTLDDRLAEMLGLNLIFDTKKEEDRIERVTAATVYYALMLMVVLAALEVVGLTHAVQPLNDLLSTVAGALPRAGWAAALLAIAWLAASVLRVVVTNAMDTAGIDARLAQLSGEPDAGDEDADHALSRSTGQVVFWLVMAVGLAGAFDALEVTPIAEPLSNAMDQVIGYLPSVGVAAVILGGAWVLGRIARTVVTNLVASAGLDRWTERLQLQALFEQRPASDLLGLLVHLFIQLQAIIAALNELGLETLSQPLTDAMSQFWTLLPKLGVSALFIAAGVVLGRIARSLATNLLKSLGFDDILGKLGLGKLAEDHEELDDASEWVGTAVYAGIVLVTVEQALANLGLDAWAGYVAAFLEYAVTNVVVAILIVGVGLFVSNKVRDLIAATAQGDEARAWIAELARYAVLVFAFTAAIRHLNVAEDFVMITFALLFGALCLAMALAFGMGGREVAGRIVAEQYDKATGSESTE